MDQDRFDRLTRMLASGQSRRSVLKGMVASVLGGTLAAAGLASVAAKPAKVGICHRDKGDGSYTYIEVSAGAVPTHKKHGDVVTNLTDVNNCGACGNDCGEYLECCNGRCTYREEYFQDDSANCGECGKACAPGSACLDGVCIDVQDDVANCGAVRHDCRFVYNSNEVDCVEGSCYRLCGGDVCADGACYAMCIDPICVGTKPCGGYREKCCASHDLASSECFGPDRCPTTTQRFIEVR